MQFLKKHKKEIAKDFRACKGLDDLLVLLNKVEELYYSENSQFKFKRKKIKKRNLTFLLYSKKDKYRSFEIPKKSGGTRLIIAPNRTLKRVQRLLLFCLESLYTPLPTATGFVRDRNIVSNAEKHCNKKYVYNIDLENFFPSIQFKRIWSALTKLRQIKLENEVARIVASLCCKDGILPQGAPTSPFLSNIICIKLDALLYNFSKRNNCTFTRYADDITFSTNENVFNDSFRSEIEEIIINQGFSLNTKKERLQRNNVIAEDGNLIRERQEVTGIIVNKKPNLSKTYIRNLRATLHNWDKKGYKAASVLHEMYYKRGKGFVRYNGSIPKMEVVVGGKLEFLGMVRGKDNSLYIGMKLLYDFLCKKENYSQEEYELLLQLFKTKGAKAVLDRYYHKKNLDERETQFIETDTVLL